LGLAERGAYVVVVDLDLENAGQVAEEIQKNGSKSAAVKADMTDPVQVDGIFAEAANTFGRCGYCC
jgi:NAD(P)-dependent dehydrogenase (short-subunit alcohol dehydrogenase family)